MAEQVNFGESSTATGDNAAVFGLNSHASGTRSVAFGTASNAEGANAAVFGSGGTALGNGSVAFGFKTQANGPSSAAFGSKTEANATRSVAFGAYTKANGGHSAAFGVYSSTEGNASAAFGQSTKANGDYSASFGGGSKADGNYSASFGHYTTAQARGQFVAGQYNYQFPDVSPAIADFYDPLFVIGNGVNSNVTSNAITVFRNGHTVIHGRMTAMQGITTGSDERLKNSIMPLVDSIDKVRQLQGVSYLLDSDTEQKTQVGFVAQEMERVVPEVVHEGRDGYLSIAYGQLTPLLVESVKTIDFRVESMDSKLIALKLENSLLKASLCEIKSTLTLCD